MFFVFWEDKTMAPFWVGWPNPQEIDVEAYDQEPRTIAPVRWRENTAPLQQKQASFGVSGFAKDGVGFQETIPLTFRENPTKWPIIYWYISRSGHLNGAVKKKGYPREVHEIDFRRNLDPIFFAVKKYDDL